MVSEWIVNPNPNKYVPVKLVTKSKDKDRDTNFSEKNKKGYIPWEIWMNGKSSRKFPRNRGNGKSLRLLHFIHFHWETHILPKIRKEFLFT